MQCKRGGRPGTGRDGGQGLVRHTQRGSLILFLENYGDPKPFTDNDS